MRALRLTLIAASVAMLVGGCIETKQDMTLNPDRSGKARVEVVMSSMPFSMTPSEDPPDPAVTAKRFAKSVLDGSKGVETWSDVSYETTEDNRTRFVGTAYFRDFLKMQVQSGEVKGVTLKATPDGGMLLRMDPQQQMGKAAPGPVAEQPAQPAPQMTEEEMQQRLLAERAKWQQMKPMMAMTLGKMKMDAVFRLPGKLVEVKGFQKTPDGGVRFAFDGAKMIEVIDGLMADDAYVRENMLKGRGGMGQPPLGDKAMAQLFGTSEALEARAAPPLTAQFNYTQEAEAAKAAYPGMIKQLGLDQVPAGAPAPMLPPGFGLPGGRKGAAGGGV